MGADLRLHHVSTDEVYGDTDAPELRLITCDGYNAFTREFEENHIVYSTLVDVY